MKFIDGKPIHLFSTSVELESENVCVSPQNFGASWTLQKWLDLTEILHTCFLGEYLGNFSHLFQNFYIWGFETSFSAKTRLKTLGHAGHFKNGPIWLKFCTLAHWVNTLGCVFHFFKIFIFGAWGWVLAPKRGWKLWRRLNTSKMIRFDWNFAHLLLNTWGHFSFFLNFNFLFLCCYFFLFHLIIR